jgi:hypothetical protein
MNVCKTSGEDFIEVTAVVAFLAHPGPALLDVKEDRVDLVTPAKVEAVQVVGLALYPPRPC